MSQRLKEPKYTVGRKAWVSRTLLQVAYFKAQESQKLASKRNILLAIMELTGRIAVCCDLPEPFKIRPLIHVSQTMPFIEQSAETSRPVPPRSESVPYVFEHENIVTKILQHRKPERGYQLLISLKGEPNRNVTFLPTSIFVDKKGTVTDVLHY